MFIKRKNLDTFLLALNFASVTEAITRHYTLFGKCHFFPIQNFKIGIIKKHYSSALIVNESLSLAIID